MQDTIIPENQKCDSGCGNIAKYFSKYTGRYRCCKSSNSCPANKAKNSEGLKIAHATGKMYGFTCVDRSKSRELFVRNSYKDVPFAKLGKTMRKRIVLEDQDHSCLHCGLAEWLGQRIALELDHIDGNRRNNVRENLRGLCPNCHSATDTWKVGLNKLKKRKATDEQILDAYKKTETVGGTLKMLNMHWGSASTVKRVLYRHKIIDEFN